MTVEKFEGERTLMRIHMGESDKWRGKSLPKRLLNCPGARDFPVQQICAAWEVTVARAHTTRIKFFGLSQDLPIVVEVIETAEKIENMLPQLDEMIGGGLVKLEEVRVILYRSATKK